MDGHHCEVLGNLLERTPKAFFVAFIVISSIREQQPGVIEG